jgi:hypothetical protein
MGYRRYAWTPQPPLDGLDPQEQKVTARFKNGPSHIQDLASEKYELFKQDRQHPSLGFQAKGSVWTVDIGRSYRAITQGTGGMPVPG